jgi:non-homologous end joining protein Ku
MASAWKGFITFGLISIPVKLYPAARSARVGLHQLHSVCKTRLRQPLFCPACNRIVDRSEVVKGYEYEDGKYVLIDPEEIKKITPESARAMEILAFVKQSEIDPLFFDSSYFIVPDDQGKKAYKLLLKTMEIKLADQLVDNLSEKFQLNKYHDEFETRLRALIEAKQKGREVTAAPRPARAPVIDIMAALKKSLERTEARKGPLRSAKESAAHEKRTRRKAS